MPALCPKAPHTDTCTEARDTLPLSLPLIQVPVPLPWFPPSLVRTHPQSSLWVTRAPPKDLRGRGRHAVMWDPNVPL